MRATVYIRKQDEQEWSKHVEAAAVERVSVISYLLSLIRKKNKRGNKQKEGEISQ